MTCRSLHFLVPGIGPAGLPLPAQAWPEPEHPVHRPGTAEAAEATQAAQAAQAESAPWTPDPGSLEFASWTAHMWASVR